MKNRKWKRRSGPLSQLLGPRQPTSPTDRPSLHPSSSLAHARAVAGRPQLARNSLARGPVHRPRHACPSSSPAAAARWTPHDSPPVHLLHATLNRHATKSRQWWQGRARGHARGMVLSPPWRIAHATSAPTTPCRNAVRCPRCITNRPPIRRRWSSELRL